jgi:hypothetical protein
MPGRSILLVALLLSSLMAPGAALAQVTPEGTPAPACVFPPVSTERLREIERDLAEHPIPTPTPSDRGYWTSKIHVRPFPPPAGDPLDDAALASLRAFLGDYTQCMVDGRLLSVYGAWTEEFLRTDLGQRQPPPDPLIDILEATPDLVFPHPGLQLLFLRAWSIESGHVVAVVQLVWGGLPESWVMYLLPEDGSWRIDDIWDIPQMEMLEGSMTGPVYGTPIAVD